MKPLSYGTIWLFVGLTASGIFSSGCRKSSPPPAQQATDQQGQADWALSSMQTAPPPATPGTTIPPGQAPTRYANVPIGAETTFRQYAPDGSSTLRITEFIDRNEQMVHARQSVESIAGKFTCLLSYSRYKPETENDKETSETIVKNLGERSAIVAGKKLRCRLVEKKQNGITFRSLICPDVPGEMVKYSDNAGNRWTVRLELVDFREMGCSK